jgi:hypothetical protein
VARNSKKSRENGITKTSIIIRKARILIKAKALQRKIFTMTTLKFVEGVVVIEMPHC